MKLKSAKFYQGVRITHRVQTSIQIGNTGMQSLEAIPNLGVLIRCKFHNQDNSDVDVILVPFPNVAYAEVDESEVKSEEPKKAKAKA